VLPKPSKSEIFKTFGVGLLTCTLIITAVGLAVYVDFVRHLFAFSILTCLVGSLIYMVGELVSIIWKDWSE